MSAFGCGGWLGLVLACGGWLGLAAVALIGVLRAGAGAERAQRASHEVRGALSALGLGLELSRRTGGIPAQRMRALELELGRARQALEDLAGGRPPRDGGEDVSVAALLADLVEAWRPAADGRELLLDLGDGGSLLVHGSRPRLTQATANLIANAMEHGDGTVVVSARSVGTSLRIEVRDEGRGMPAPLAHLTSHRSLLAWPPARQARGHGLRIVADVARSHGGRLELAPSGAGARLVLWLPLTSASGGAGCGAPAATPPTAGDAGGAAAGADAPVGRAAADPGS